MAETITITITDEDEAGGMFDVETKLPAKFVVCPRCDGRGVHDHPAFSNGISPSDFAEDPDFAEEYFRGSYDVACSVCHGGRVVKEVDHDHLTANERRLFALYEAAEELDLHFDELFEAERAAERRMGA